MLVGCPHRGHSVDRRDIKNENTEDICIAQSDCYSYVRSAYRQFFYLTLSMHYVYIIYDFLKRRRWEQPSKFHAVTPEGHFLVPSIELCNFRRANVVVLEELGIFQLS